MAGRRRAADALGKPVEGVLPTTNHLESFNRVLKRGYIRRAEAGGKHLRFDIFFHFLITSIIPSIFETRRHEADHAAWVIARFGGYSLLLWPSDSQQDSLRPIQHPIAWIPVAVEQSSRQLEGADMAKLNRIDECKYIGVTGSAELVGASCWSSKATPLDPHPNKCTL